MNRIDSGRAQDPAHYEIRLDGHLDPRWTASFAGLGLTNREDGTTVLCGAMADQAALYGVLRQVQDLGLTLLSVTQLHPDRPTPPAVYPR